MLEGWFLLFIIVWSILMLVLMAIGGYFMFRKFLKQLPKADGKSDMDWQEYYLQKTAHLWGPAEKELLDDLVRPVPKLFRDAAKNSVAGMTGKLALQEQCHKITRDLVIRGYILATPKRDHRFLKKKVIRDEHRYQAIYPSSLKAVKKMPRHFQQGTSVVTLY